jgi:NAD(P)-dependent dehydrogenase (short-subunit alcohol dehydrogenase family)
VVPADLTREAQVERMWKRIDSAMGEVDTVVANAGSWETRDVPLHQMSLEQWNSTLDAVLTSSFLTTRAFLQRVGTSAPRKRGAGGIDCRGVRRGGPCRLRLGQGSDGLRTGAHVEE